MDKDFDSIKEDLTAQGYKLKSSEFDIAIIYASMFLVLPIAATAFILYLIQSLKYPELSTFPSLWEYPIMMVILAFVHEGIHGICFAFFSKNGFRSLKFGLSKQSFYCPFCHCKTTVSMVGYMISALMPFVLLGIVPAIISISTINGTLNQFALMGIIGGAADVLFCCELLKQKKILPQKGQIHVYDYVDKMGFAVFYKEKDTENKSLY